MGVVDQVFAVSFVSVRYDMCSDNALVMRPSSPN